MNKIEKAVIEIKKQLYKNKNIFAVILYGSVSRGDYSIRHSDIDLLVVLNEVKDKSRVDKIINDLYIRHRVKIHPEYQGGDIKNEDQTLLCKMFEEGKILFSKGFWFVSKKQLGLESFRLYNFDTSQIDKISRVMFSRALHGREGSNGLIDNISIIDSGKGGLLVRKNMFKEIEMFFDRFKVKYKVIKTVYG